MRRPVLVRSERPSALTTPAVTVQSKPNGLPIAMAIWPTLELRRVAKLDRRQLGGDSRTHGEIGVGIVADQVRRARCGRRAARP